MPNVPKLRAVRPSPEPPADGLVLVRLDDLRRVVRGEIDQALGQSREQPAVLLDRGALARALSVSMPTIDRLRRAGMPVVWVVQAPRFELSAVLAWLRDRNGP